MHKAKIYPFWKGSITENSGICPLFKFGDPFAADDHFILLGCTFDLQLEAAVEIRFHLLNGTDTYDIAPVHTKKIFSIQQFF